MEQAIPKGVFVPIEWRHQYDPFIDETVGDLAATDNAEPSLTNQHFAKDADLNTIIQRYGISDGAPIPEGGIDQSFIADFTDAPDFRDALDTTRRAQETFGALPASIRTKFKNDPVRLWEFINDESNHEECIKMGILKREASPPKPQDTDKPVSAST